MKALFLSILLAATINSTNAEISVGTCLNADGDGHIESSTDGVEEPYTYINYTGTGAEAGDKVITITFYQDGEEHTDNYVMIADYVPAKDIFSVR